MARLAVELSTSDTLRCAVSPGLAWLPGFEPGLTGPKPAVLPVIRKPIARRSRRTTRRNKRTPHDVADNVPETGPSVHGPVLSVRPDTCTGLVRAEESNLARSCGDFAMSHALVIADVQGQ